jgi:hypothetical protein
LTESKENCLVEEQLINESCHGKMDDDDQPAYLREEGVPDFGAESRDKKAEGADTEPCTDNRLDMQ